VDLTLPLVVVQHDRRLVEAWIPRFPEIKMTGPSLAEIRDDLALAVMERFYVERAERFGEYQIAPSARVEHVLIERAVQDAERKQRWELKGRIGVLVERWPDGAFLVVTPTRLPLGRFAVTDADHLEEAVAGRVAAWSLETDTRTLAPWHCTRRERLELLEVSAIAPTILPHTHPRARKLRKPPSAAEKDKSKGEGPEEELDPDDPDAPAPEPPTAKQRHERRHMARLTARVLRQVGRNLSHAVEDDNLGRAFGRDGFVDQLVDDLGTREGAAIVLVGPPGVGKSAVVHEFCRRLHAYNARSGLRRDVWRVDGNRFIAGMKYVGQWEARARELIEELSETGDILYLDDLASMVVAGRTGTGDTNVAQFLGPAVARGGLTIIAESTPERLAWAREEAPGFVQLFRAIPIEPMEARASLPVLIGALRSLESEGEEQAAPQRMTPNALEMILRLSERFLPTEAFPGKAVRLLRATLDRAVEPTDARGGGSERRYGAAQVQATLQQRTGLPDFILDAAQALPRDEILARFQRHIAGQPEALDALSDLVVALQQGLCDPGKPLGTFLFVGPTGVGKTESARALAQVLFGSPERLIRFDMSEFAEAYAVSRLIGHPGAPDGELTSALRVQPFCVVLFDEIEKAHPRVFDALLQLLGEGRLSDAAGRLADARQAVIIMTSNLGVREAASQTGFVRGSADGARAHYVSAAQRFFRPEFFNRIDRLVPFRSLEPEALRRVVEHQLGELLGRRGIAGANMLVEVEPAMLDALVERAYDPRYGARPLKREMERQLTVPLAHHLVRRRDDDLTLVMLQRLGGAMELRVRTLRELTFPSLRRAVPTTPRACLDAFRELADALDTFQEDLQPLLEARSGDPRLDLARGQLLDAIRELREGAQRAEEDPLLTDEFIEEESPPEEVVSPPFHTRYRQGLRPRPAYTLVQTHSPPGLLVHRATRLLVPLLDAADALAAQARAAHTLDRWTLLLEAMPGAVALERLDALRDALASALPAIAIEREIQNDQGASWEPVTSAPQAGRQGAPSGGPGAPGSPAASPPLPSRRARVVLEGFALGALASTLSGFAITGIDHLGSHMTARVHALEGHDPASLVAELDARREATRARRHQGEGLAVPDVPDRVVFRDQQRQRWIHLPTGLSLGPGGASRDELLAAAIRIHQETLPPGSTGAPPATPAPGAAGPPSRGEG
jgi:ATP-dependent Clp protease ATP-binding subunit ClpC